MSFMEGFAGSIGQYFLKNAADAQDFSSYKKKLKLAMQLEEENKKLRPSGPPKLFKQGDVVMAQAVNEYGEPIGGPRIANDWDKQDFTTREEDRKTQKELQGLQIENQTLDKKLRGMQVEQYPEMAELDMKAKRANIAQSEASTNRDNIYATLAKEGKLGGGSTPTTPTMTPGQKDAGYRAIIEQHYSSLPDDVKAGVKERQARGDTPASILIYIEDALNKPQKEPEAAGNGQTSEELAVDATSDRSPALLLPSILEQAQGRAGRVAAGARSGFNSLQDFIWGEDRDRWAPPKP